MMINHIPQLKELISGSALESFELAELPIPETEHKVLAIKVNHDHALSAWQVMKAKIGDTGRWPVLIACWGNRTSSWHEQLHQENLFDRFPFQYELDRKNRENFSPEIIISGAEQINLEASLNQLSLNAEEDLKDYLADIISETQEQFGETPEASLLNQLIESGELNSEVDLERWLFNWEIEHFGEKATASIDNSYIHWFDPVHEPMSLLLMPTINSWETPGKQVVQGAIICCSHASVKASSGELGKV